MIWARCETSVWTFKLMRRSLRLSVLNSHRQGETYCLQHRITLFTPSVVDICDIKQPGSLLRNLRNDLTFNSIKHMQAVGKSGKYSRELILSELALAVAPSPMLVRWNKMPGLKALRCTTTHVWQFQGSKSESVSWSTSTPLLVFVQDIPIYTALIQKYQTFGQGFMYVGLDSWLFVQFCLWCVDCRLVAAQKQ